MLDNEIKFFPGNFIWLLHRGRGSSNDLKDRDGIGPMSRETPLLYSDSSSNGKDCVTAAAVTHYIFWVSVTGNE